ncbi:lipoprotein [Mycoplasmopsis bovigenitalium]|uniref:Lipoprotein n=1 Tax=Mycoplasmopsis bovigenitalium TaxID=2112 RepID=A0A449A8H2_9BACT|nr:hypothetical protein [Mycoplasmopsis bovigenitalium]VEU60562.1 lipoprotein [Mycoplasmopsis bovigenitalium]
MKKKLGFLITSCMSVSALPLFAAACKNEQANAGKQEEVDVNTLFKISLPKNTEKKPSELKPKDIVVEILNNDVNVKIQKVEFKDGKGVLVSYLATNTKTNKIVDEKTITLEVTTKKDQAEPKKDKKYDDLVTVSVDESKKSKVADEATKEDIIVSKAEGETFTTEVLEVKVQNKNLDTVNVKIKVVDGKIEKTITKTISGFKEATPNDVKEGYLIFKDLEIVDADQAKKWLKEAKNGTIVYYDYKTHEFYTKKFDNKNPNDSERFAILKPKQTPKWGIETASPDAKQGNKEFKGTAKLVKEENKVGIEFKISKYNSETKTANFFDMVKKSNLIDIPEIKTTESAGANSNGTIDTPNSGKSEKPQGDQPGGGNANSSGAENGNVLNENDISQTLMIPELYKPSLSGKLFVVEEETNKGDIIKGLDEAIKSSQSSLRIDAGKLNIKRGKSLKGISFVKEIDSSIVKKINTHGSKGASIGYKFNGSRKGIKVENIGGNKYKLSWYLITKDGKPTDTIFTQEIDLS